MGDGTVPWDEVGGELTRIFAPKGASCITVQNTGHHLLLEYPDYAAQCAACWFTDSQEPQWKELLSHTRLKPIADVFLTGTDDSNERGAMVAQTQVGRPNS